MIKVLHLAADPFRQEALNLAQEIRQVQQALRNAGCTDVVVESEWAVQPQELQQALLRHRPDVVHFSGHGAPNACLVLEGDNGPVEVSQDALTGLFRALGESVRLVVLNACHSHSQAEALAPVVGSAIGMRTAVTDDAAIAFSASFYQALAYGKSIQVAFEAAKNAIALQGMPDEDVPRLYSVPPGRAREFLVRPRVADTPPGALTATRGHVGGTDRRGRSAALGSWIANARLGRHVGVFALLQVGFYAIASIPVMPAETYALAWVAFAIYVGLHLYLRNAGA